LRTGPMLFSIKATGPFHEARRLQVCPSSTGNVHARCRADYDRDGRLDIYFCMYMYYLGLDQYTIQFPITTPAMARRIASSTMKQRSFEERTEETGLNAETTVIVFHAPGATQTAMDCKTFLWSTTSAVPALSQQRQWDVHVVSHQANVEGVGAGMSCAWCDYDNDGHQDVYVPSMWRPRARGFQGKSNSRKRAAEYSRTLPAARSR